MDDTKVPKGRREEYTEATRQALLAAGREAFATGGFQSAGIEAISRAARVTRGAFYHHFADKTALFDAVVVLMQTETAAKVEERARARHQVWDRLGAGIEAYLDACLEPAYGRIVVREAPAVLGSKRFREIEGAHTLALVRATLEALKRRGELAFDDVGLLAHMVDAMVCELALLLPEAGDPQALRARGQEVIAKLLGSYRKL